MQWWCMLKVLKRDRATALVMARFYLAVVQTVLLYRSDSWTISKQNMAKLNVFHKRAVRHMTGQHIWKKADGSWSYPYHQVFLKKCQLLPVKKYITQQRGTLRQYLTEEKLGLLADVEGLSALMGDARKVLWGKQEWISREKMQDLATQRGE